MKNPRVAVVSVAYPSNFGGAEVVWKNINVSNTFDFYTIDNKEFGALEKIPHLFHLREILLSSFIWKKIKDKNYDLIIYDKILGWNFGKTSAIKIAYGHGLYSSAGAKFKGKYFIIRWIYKTFIKYFERRSYQKADGIIAVSQSEKEELIKTMGLPQNKIRVINNGVDHNKFKPLNNRLSLKRKYKIPEDKFIILFPSRPSYCKGFDLAKKTAKKLSHNVQIIVLSDGKDTENISYLGKMSHEDMPELYNCADVVLFPSRYEGFGLVPIEAAACGVPLISSYVGIIKLHPTELSEYIAESHYDITKIINGFIRDKNSLKKAGERWYKFSNKFPIEKQIKELNEYFEAIN